MQEAPRTAPALDAGAELSPASVHAPTACLNCGATVDHAFCAECGQPVIDPDPTLRELVHELAEGFLNWDGKLLGTLRLLVTSPGMLTKEFLAGRRVRFISPLRVYLTCSFLYFFVKAMLPDVQLQITTTSSEAGKGASPHASAMQIGVVTVQQSDETESPREIEKQAKSDDGVKSRWFRHFAVALRDKGRLSAAVASNVPRMMFVLVPLFATLTALAFRRRRMRYPQHLAFALHVHAFLFLALLLTLVTRVVKIGWFDAIVVVASFGAIAAHIVLATRRVYEVSTGGAIAKSSVIAAAYFVAFGLAMAALFIGVVFFDF